MPDLCRHRRLLRSKRENRGGSHELLKILPPPLRIARFQNADRQLVDDDGGKSDFGWGDREKTFRDTPLPLEKVDDCVGVEKVHQNDSRAASSPSPERISAREGKSSSDQAPASLATESGQ